MAKFLRRLFITYHWWSVGLLGIAFVWWWRIALSGSFGDEQENFVASWLVQQGLVPYRDFFFHHAPLPYFLGSPLFSFNPEPWVWFRWLMFGWWAIWGWFTWVLIQPKFRPIVGLSWLGLVIMAPGLQLQQYLAESLLVPVVVSLFLLVVSQVQTGVPRITKLLGVALVFGWIMIGSTVVALPIWAWLCLGIAGAWFGSGHRYAWKQIPWGRFTLLALLLWGGSVGYFWQHQALQTAWWDSITYNFEYYFPVRLAANEQQVHLGYFLSVVQNFYHYAVGASSITWQATDALVHTVFTTAMAGLSLPESVLRNWLLVAATEWQHKVITVAVLSWLGWVLVVLGFPKNRGWWVGVIWWLGLALVLRGRENEGFKLGVYYAVITAAMCGVAWQALVTWWGRKRSDFWSFLMVVVCLGWFGGWLSLFAPSYRAAQALPPQIIPVKTLQAAAKLQSALETLPAIQNQRKIYILGGNPVYYVLVHRIPVVPEFYYHPWFHKAPKLQMAVHDFLQTTTTVPVVLESELDGSSLDFASELETLVRQRASGHTESVYWMTGGD